MTKHSPHTVDVHLKDLRSNVHNKTDAKLVQLISGMLDNRSDPAGRLLNTMQLNTNRLTSRFWIRINKVCTGDIAGVRVDLVPQLALLRRVGIPWSILDHDQQACPVGVRCDNINRGVIPDSRHNPPSVVMGSPVDLPASIRAVGGAR